MAETRERLANDPDLLARLRTEACRSATERFKPEAQRDALGRAWGFVH